MRAVRAQRLRARCEIFIGFAFILAVGASPAGAAPMTLEDWQERYGQISQSGDNAQCQLCHADAISGGSPWNAYGWRILLSRDEPSCDTDRSGDVSNLEAFVCVDPLDSDGDPGGFTNLQEIERSTQPGWTEGPNNTLFDRGGETANQLPPSGIGDLDPPTGPTTTTATTSTSTTSTSTTTLGRGQAGAIIVRPGDSIQAAVDAAAPGTTILVFPGVYHESADEQNMNALQISKDGIRLIGIQAGEERVILENAGNQSNGIVVVPPERADCMSCHTSMAPPFPLSPEGEAAPPPERKIYGFEIQGFTIRGFSNNGLFTENVDGFRITNVASVDNLNYGIFPTLSQHGVISHSHATGSNDSGIWVETSEHVRVTHNLVERNVNGIEVSNSDDILVAHNEMRDNTAGISLFVLTDLVDERPGANRITVRDNWIHRNNNPNSGTPGTLLSFVPSGTGILHLAVDNSRIENNRIENNDFFGIAMADYCLAVLGTDFDCFLRPPPPEFDPAPENNRVVRNILINNGMGAPRDHPFAFAAADIAILTLEDLGNCFERNSFATFFSLLGELPPCR